MQKLLQTAQGRLANLTNKAAINIEQNQLSSALAQENQKTSLLHSQINTINQQIATAKNTLVTTENTLTKLQNIQQEQHAQVAKVNNLLSDFVDIKSSTNNDADDLVNVLGLINNLSFQE